MVVGINSTHMHNMFLSVSVNLVSKVNSSVCVCTRVHMCMYANLYKAKFDSYLEILGISSPLDRLQSNCWPFHLLKIKYVTLSTERY